MPTSPFVLLLPFFDTGDEWLLEAKLKASIPTFPRHSFGFGVRQLSASKSRHLENAPNPS